MTLENWSDVFHKLSRPIESYMQCLEKPLASEKISLRRSQLELRVSWHKTDSAYTAFFENADDRNWCPYFIKVEIKAVSKISEYRKVRDNESSANKPSNRTDHKDADVHLNDSTDSIESKNSEVENLLQNQVEEYVPTAMQTDDSPAKTTYPKYTPTPVLMSSATENTDDEYTPSISGSKTDAFDKNSYQPSPIVPHALSAEKDSILPENSSSCSTDMVTKRKRSAMTTKTNDKRDEHEFKTPEKTSETNDNHKTETPRSKVCKNGDKILLKNRQSEDLFGESDSENRPKQNVHKAPLENNEWSSAKRPTLSRKVKEGLTYHDDEVSHTHNSKPENNQLKIPKTHANSGKRFKSSNQWLSKESLKEKSKEKEKETKDKKTNRLKLSDKKVAITNEEITEYNKSHERNMEQLRNIQARLEEANKPILVKKIM